MGIGLIIYKKMMMLTLDLNEGEFDRRLQIEKKCHNLHMFRGSLIRFTHVWRVFVQIYTCLEGICSNKRNGSGYCLRKPR